MPARSSLQALATAPLPGMDLGTNMAAGQDVINSRRSAMRDAYTRGDRARVSPGGYDDTMRQVARSEAADHTPWGDFYAALVGKEALTTGAGMGFKADIRQLGRLKAYDPALGKTYDVQSGETAPGFRPNGGGYTPWEEDYIKGSNPALNALRRATGKSGVVL